MRRKHLWQWRQRSIKEPNHYSIWKSHTRKILLVPYDKTDEAKKLYNGQIRGCYNMQNDEWYLIDSPYDS